ncbi:MAG: CatB-related O-acetyltransferase [Acidobacteria bacterium]|nr:CatB-related O-acetyltransferase [Acidobacteriota bacterium]
MSPEYSPEELGALASHGVVLTRARRGAAAASPVRLEPPVHVCSETSFDFPFSVGAFSHLNGGFIQNVTIGRYCSFARDVQIGHGSHPANWLSVSPLQYVRGYRGWSDFLTSQGLPVHAHVQPFEYGRLTTIGNDVWLGNQVFVKDGVTIGDGAIVGAGSIVTKDIPPYTIVAGNPAKIVRPRFPDRLIERFLALQWWRFALPSLPALSFDDPARALDQLEALIDASLVKEYRPAPICLPDFLQQS